MRKDFGLKTIITPLPVLILATYDENGVPNAMNAAWGGQYDTNEIFVSLAKHKTTDNLILKKAFTDSFATADTVKESDYFGIESGRKINKIEKAGFHAVKSAYVDAPIITEYPLTLECRVKELQDDKTGYILIGEVVNLSADESILTDGEVDLSKLRPIMFDSASNKYRVIGEVIADAFAAGKELL
ncbi:MAG: flavin reductase family protein [Solobacterium sp.]|nr:flavin reductase family protein [Solobacterium sp.]